MAEFPRTQEGRAEPAPERSARERKARRSRRVPEEIGAGRVETSVETLSVTAFAYFFTTAPGSMRFSRRGKFRTSSEQVMRFPYACYHGSQIWHSNIDRKIIVMPMSGIGSFSLVKFAAFCAVLALPLGLAPAAAGQSTSSSGKSSANFETLAANAGSAREAGR